MSHTKELINNIIENELLDSYPRSRYKYLIEKKLEGYPKVIYPDIQILEGTELICTVEIGYTRPEKIQFYRQLRINDIRWYSKQGKLINPPSSKEVKQYEWKPNKNETWRSLWLASGEAIFTCWDCWNGAYNFCCVCFLSLSSLHDGDSLLLESRKA